MSTVTLKSNASIQTRGYKFLRGVPRDDIPYDTAVELADDKRFVVVISKEEHQQAAFRAGGKPESKQARINMIAVACDELEQGNPEHFKADGTPDARALTAILGWQVTKDERDLAWKQKNAPKKVQVSPEAPKPEGKGDLQSGELKGGKKPMTKAERIIAKEEAKERLAAKQAAQKQGAPSDEDDDDLPPMDPEDGSSDEGADGEGGEGGAEEATDLDLTDDEDGEGSGEPIEPAEDQEAEDESTGGKDATGGDDSGDKSEPNTAIRKGKLKLNKGTGHASVDPTTAGAKEI